MIDLVRDIKTALEGVIQTHLGPTYKKLAYVEDVEKNNYLSNSERYGVRALGGFQVPGVTKEVHITHNFEVVLTKAYLDSNITDSEQVIKSLDNFENLLGIYKELVNSRGGAPSLVLNITNLVILDPEYLVDSKVAVQRATMDITYRFSLI